MKSNHQQRKILLISSLGGVLEYYDFIIYALLAGYISKLFFPTSNAVTSLLAAFAAYTVGYIARPIGGLILGHFGDRYGRSKTFSVSILMMALATFSIGLLPTYNHIGLLAPLLLTLLRIMQGFSVGGEIPGAITYISERMPEQKGFACGAIFFGITSGVVLGSLIIALLQSLLSTQVMQVIGWRIPFLLGGVFGMVSYRYRKQLKESQEFLVLGNTRQPYPFVTALKLHRKNLLYGFTLMSLAAIVATLLSVYIPAYLNNIVKHSIPNYMWYFSATLLLSALSNMLVGYLSDKIDRNKLILALCSAAILVPLPMYLIYNYYLNFFILALILSVVPNALAFGLIPRVLADLFPTEIRYSAIAFCYSTSFAIFGGISPLLATYLIYRSQLQIAPAIIVCAMGIMTLIIHFYFKMSSYPAKTETSVGWAEPAKPNTT